MKKSFEFGKSKLNFKTKWVGLPAIFCVLTIAVLVACNKINSNGRDSNLNSTLNIQVLELKNWFDGSFAKTANFNKTVVSYGNANEIARKENIFTSVKEANLLNNVNQVKWPIWKKAKLHNEGNRNSIEVPLRVENEVFRALGLTLKDEEVNKVRAARQNRAIFTKSNKSGYSKNSITIIPSYNFLKSHNFDISNISFYDLKKNKFEGNVIIKDWNEKILKYFMYRENGKRKSIVIKNVMENNNSNRTECDYQPVGFECHPRPTCFRVDDESGPCGSLPHDPVDCTTIWDNVCVEVEEEEVDCSSHPMPAACECEQYGIGCPNDDGNGGDDDDENLSNCNSELTNGLADMIITNYESDWYDDDEIKIVSTSNNGISVAKDATYKWKVGSLEKVGILLDKYVITSDNVTVYKSEPDVPDVSFSVNEAVRPWTFTTWSDGGIELRGSSLVYSFSNTRYELGYPQYQKNTFNKKLLIKKNVLTTVNLVYKGIGCDYEQLLRGKRNLSARQIGQF